MAHATAENPKIRTAEDVLKEYKAEKPVYVAEKKRRFAEGYFSRLYKADSLVPEWTLGSASAAKTYAGAELAPLNNEKANELAEHIVTDVARKAAKFFGIDYDKATNETKEHFRTLVLTDYQTKNIQTIESFAEEIGRYNKVNYGLIDSTVGKLVQNARGQILGSVYTELSIFKNLGLAKEVAYLLAKLDSGIESSLMIDNLKGIHEPQKVLPLISGLENKIMGAYTEAKWREKPQEGKPGVPDNHEELEKLFNRTEAPHEEAPTPKKPLEEMAGARH